MFDDISEAFEKMTTRTTRAVEALEKAKKKGTEKGIETVQKELPLMKISVDLEPMFDSPEEAKKASEDKELILIESFKKNLIDYIQKGI